MRASLSVGSNPEGLKCNGMSPEIIFKYPPNVNNYGIEKIDIRELCVLFL